MNFDRTGYSECDRCPFCKNNKVWDEGPPSPLAAVIGEAPGREEDRLMRPFVGQSGNALNVALQELNIPRELLWIGNIISCRPPNNQFKHPDSVIAVRRCSSGFEAELKMLYQSGIRNVLALGANAGASFGFFGAMSENREKLREYRILEDYSFRIHATYHPSYIVRNGVVGKIGNDLWELWKSDIERGIKGVT